MPAKRAALKTAVSNWLRNRWGSKFNGSNCGATFAALTAIYLGGIVGDYEESRLSIVLLATVRLFFTLSAWRCAVNRNFAAHRLFMIRSDGLALVLAWLRLMYDFQGWLFFYVTNETSRDATREWASWIVPLLVLELWLSWIPLLRSKRSRPSASIN